MQLVYAGFRSGEVSPLESASTSCIVQQERGIEWRMFLVKTCFVDVFGERLVL